MIFPVEFGLPEVGVDKCDFQRCGLSDLVFLGKVLE